MKNLTVLAVAFAAGLTTFAASAKDTEIASVGSPAEKVAEKAKEALPCVDVTKTSSIGAAGKSGKNWYALAFSGS